MNWTIGVDVGGTFTDFCAIAQETGEVRLWKRPSTPNNPALAILAGLEEMATVQRIDLASVTRIAHGTTIATNTLIQRKGRPVALVTTRGFRDLVEIGRQTRPHLYDLQRDYPAPLVPRDLRLEITERITAAGAVHRPVEKKDIDEVIVAIRQMDVEAVAVCFLFSFLNPEHERQVAERLRSALPHLKFSISSEVQPEFREYERFTTTIINAYLQPILHEYIDMLKEGLSRLVPQAAVGINQSSGGLMTPARAKDFPARTALSGPAAGVVGAIHVARTTERANVITIDVGGTSADVAMIRNHRFDVSYGRDVDGFPIRLPMVDIQTIGAGGGSIAWIDRDGLMKMGPRSAGAVPGPACYGLGGTEATLSDANLVLGRLSPQLLNGTMSLDSKLAHLAVDKIGTLIGKSAIETAYGMVAISIANMVRAIRVLSVERGHDPRDYALIAFGGAGPLHARDIAAAISIKEIIIPLAPGIVCAQGLVISDLKEDFVGGTRVVIEEAVPASIRNAVVELKQRACSWASSENIPLDRINYELSFDMRYVGQNFEISVPMISGHRIELVMLPSAVEVKTLFFNAHDLAYGFHDPTGKIEVVHVRLTARAPLFQAADERPRSMTTASAHPTGERAVYFSLAKPVATPVYKRDQLPIGTELIGPAIIDQLDTTTPIFPGDCLKVHSSGSLVIEVRA